jgi:4-diphosphocytidyl-2-C-methyl-D-erythritol kinase
LEFAVSEWQRTWPAPAKVNLFLHVVGRRPDGYHLLQTVFRFLDYGDELRFAPRSDDRIVLATATPGVNPDQDLTVRAAQALAQASGCRRGVTIELAKRIPIGGGLGGGSSDAATTLMALNRLWRCGLDGQALEKLGLALGADVPVFVHGRSCFAEGVGERFADVALPAAWYLVAVPPVAVPTAAVFADAALRRNAPAIAAADWRPGTGGNDLEPVACRLFPEVAAMLGRLARFGTARMSGSGASCFVEFHDEQQARAALAGLGETTLAFVARGVDQHPIRN